jgi:hypothetical protein
MEPGTVVAAIDLLGKASKALDSLRERAKTSKDADLKEAISNLYDQFLDLKELVLRIKEENAELRRAIAAQAETPPNPEIRQVGETHYYYLGEDGPFCQPCYDRDHKLMRLMPAHESVLGLSTRCEVCGKVFFEVRKKSPRIHVSGSPWS